MKIKIYISTCPPAQTQQLFWVPAPFWSCFSCGSSNLTCSISGADSNPPNWRRTHNGVQIKRVKEYTWLCQYTHILLMSATSTPKECPHKKAGGGSRQFILGPERWGPHALEKL